jgi:hypothetical protein
MKECITCHILKEETDYKSGNKCKACVSEYKHQHYLANKDVYINRAHKHYAENIEQNRARCKVYRDANKEKLSEASKRYYTSDVGRLNNKLRSAKYRANEDGKLKDTARSMLAYALKTGKVHRPDICSECPNTNSIEGHHEDYSKPLEVIWLCKRCHECKHHLNEG